MRLRTLFLWIAPWWLFCLFLYAHVPPSPDDTDIDYMGWMLLRGGIQYVDFIDMNWPGAVWLHAASTLLFGNNLMSWRIFDFGIAIVAMIAMVDLLARRRRAAAVCFAILYPALYVGLGLWMAGQRDAVAGHGLVVALACHARAWEQQKLRWQLCAGIALGIAILVKPSVGFAGPILVLHGIVWSLKGQGILRAGLHGLVAGIAATGVLATGFVALLVDGAPVEAVIEGAYLLNRLGHHIVTVADRSWWLGVQNVVFGLLPWITALAAIGFAFIALERERTIAERLLLPLLIVSGLVNYWVQRKYFEYHLTVAIPGLVALACVALGEAWHRLASKAILVRLASGGVLLLALSGVAIKLGRLAQPVFSYRFGMIDRTAYYGRFRPFQIDYGRLLLLAERIEREVPSDGSVLVWGSENAINYLAKRPQPTRFHHWVALSYAKPPLPMAEKWNRQFEEDLTNRRPEMAVIDHDSLAISAARGAANHFFLERFLREGYQKVETIDAVDLYVRK